ncbi:hypothetical protein Hanom_Chr16g01489511 [Helianthus anomalus]
MIHCGHVCIADGTEREKAKPATKKENKSEEEIMSEKRHNQIAFLVQDGKITEQKEITHWIRESRINKAVTFSTPAYKSLVKALWDSLSVVQVDGIEVIQGNMNDLTVTVSPEILNTVLELQDDPNAPFSIPIMCTRGYLLRMKCTGDILSNQINKGDLSLCYKFLLHVLIQCISNRRAGYDMTWNDLIGLMVALVEYDETGSRITGNKFWMYPRFLQMIMNVQHPGLPKADNDILMIFKALAAKSYKETDPPRKLIGAHGKPDYVAPADDKWRHDYSQSDDEGPELKRKMIEKFGPEESGSSDSDSDNDEGGGGDAGAGAAGASQEDDPEYVPSDTEAERLKKKETAIKRKKKAKKNNGSSSAQQSVPQEPIQEAAMVPNLGFTAEEASTMLSSHPRSTEPAHVVSSTHETPTVTPPEPTPSITSTIRTTTSQLAAKHRQSIFSRMNQEEKVNFLFSQLQPAAGQIHRQSEVMQATRADLIRQ